MGKLFIAENILIHLNLAIVNSAKTKNDPWGV